MRRIITLLLCLIYSLGFPQKIIVAEYFIDKDPGPGKGVRVSGIPKSDSLNIKNISISTSGLKEGPHILGLRVKDSIGLWSANYISSFSILRGNGNLSVFNKSKLTTAEYFIDKDPGPGKGVRISGITKSDSLNIQNIAISTSGLKEGPHILGLRVRDSVGLWSANSISSFSILKGNGDLSAFNKSKLTTAEYFIDKDPGPGNGVKVSGIIKSDSLDVKNISIPTIGLSQGPHILGFRVKDSVGLWSANYISSFSILKGNGDLSVFNKSKLTTAEYFIDKDPGPGNGVKVSGIIKSDSLDVKNISIPTIGLSQGPHILGFRVRDSVGLWSANYISSFSILKVGDINDTSNTLLISGEYFFGKDPGYGNGKPFKTPAKAKEWDISLEVQIPDTIGLKPDNAFMFRIKQENGIWSANQTIQFDVCSTILPKPVATGITVCGGPGNGTLKASGLPSKQYAWFTDSWDKKTVKKTSAAASKTDTAYTARFTEPYTDYWISGYNPTNTTCPYGLRTKVTAEVVQVLTVPTVSNKTRCGPGRVTFTASGAPVDGTYRWYASDTSKAWLFEGHPFVTDSLAQSRSYFVETISSGGKCKSPSGKKPVATIKTCLSQTITFPFVDDIIFGFDTSKVLKAFSNRGLQIMYELISGPARFINDSTLVPTGIGEIVVRASQPGDSNFEPAANVIRRFKSLPNSSTVIIDYNKPLCTGSELKLIATAYKGAKYFWSGPKGFKSTEQSPSIYNVTLTDSGKYSLVVHAPDDTLISSVNVKIFRSPLKISLYSTLISKCSKEYKAFTEGDSIVRYQWFLDAKKIVGAEDSSLVPSITGVYSVNGYNGEGCGISSAPVYINVDPDSIPQLSRLRKPLRMRAPLAQSYLWFIDNYIVAGNNAQEIPVLFNGNYRVKIIDAKGCEKFSPIYNVFEDDLPDLRMDMVMANGTVDLEKEISGITIVPQPSSQQAEVTWSSPKRGNLIMELMDSQGKQVYLENLEKGNEIFATHVSVANLTDGLYHIRLTCDGKMVKGNVLVVK